MEIVQQVTAMSMGQVVGLNDSEATMTSPLAEEMFGVLAKWAPASP